MNIPFYVREMSKLSDDKEYFKLFLWPLLEAWHACSDVATFHSKYPSLLIEWTDDIIFERRERSLYEFLDIVEGEGTCGPGDTFTECPLTFN